MNITIEQIGMVVTFLVGLVSGILYLNAQLKKWMADSFKDQFDGINKRLDGMDTKLDEVDKEHCKNYLVTFLADVEKGNPLDEIERERFWEEYGHYIQMGGNSYIKTKADRLKAENKL